MANIKRKSGEQRDAEFEEAYWKAFERFFGPQNSVIIKAMLLARKPASETCADEIDRVNCGLRDTMAWVAEAIEKSATAYSDGLAP